MSDSQTHHTSRFVSRLWEVQGLSHAANPPRPHPPTMGLLTTAWRLHVGVQDMHTTAQTPPSCPAWSRKGEDHAEQTKGKACKIENKQKEGEGGEVMGR
ncbi:hypothetical protein FKM82_027477 [Ascaphus truei]